MKIVLGEFELDVASGQLTGSKRARRLSPRAVEVLVCLSENTGEVVSREALHQTVWADRLVTDTQISKAINELRNAFGDHSDPRQFIETLPKRGYRLLCDVQRITEDEAETNKAPLTKTPARSARSHPTDVATPLVFPLSIAVLRFDDMSPAGDHRYLCEGVSEEIIEALSGVSKLSVISRTSSFRLSTTTHSIKEIGQMLGVASVLEGSVRATANHIRISAKLIDVQTEYHRWSKIYNGQADDLFRLYDEINADVAEELGAIIGQRRLLAENPPQSFEAYAALLKARDDAATFPECIRYAEEAIELGVDYLEAHAEKGRILYYMGFFGIDEPELMYQAAKNALAECTRIDSSHWMTYQLAGQLHAGVDHNFRAAADAYEQGEIVRGMPLRQHGILLYYACAFEDALSLFAELESHDPIDASLKVWIARCLNNLNRQDKATLKIEDALRLSPAMGIVVNDAVRQFSQIKQFERARGIIDQSSLGETATARLGGMVDGFQAFSEGRTEDALSHRNRMPIEIIRAWVSFQFGDYEDHIETFRQLVERQLGINYFRVMFQDMDAYWKELLEWSLAVSEETEKRVRLIDAHRSLVERVTAKMVL